MSVPEFLYKVVTLQRWKELQELHFLPTSENDSQFIHLATGDQLSSVIDKFWTGKEHVILKLKTSELIGNLVFEKNPGGSTAYYHLYEGKIPEKALVDAKLIDKVH